MSSIPNGKYLGFFFQFEKRISKSETFQLILKSSFNLMLIVKRLVGCVEALRPSQQFFSHIGTEPSLPG